MAEPGPWASGREAADLIASAAAALHRRGERMTVPRRVVLTALANRTGHLSAEQLVAELAATNSSVHRSSVYRALDALCALGVVQHIHLGHGSVAYHLTGDGPHLHAQCRRCGVVQDLPADLLDAVAERLARERAFTLDAAHVALSGLCAGCATATPLH